MRKVTSSVLLCAQKLPTVRSASEYIDRLQTDGRLTFTTEAAVEALGGSLPAVRAQLRRLKEKGHIADPMRGFHVIVPPKYRRLGCLPAEQLVPPLMEHLGEPWYVGLLSAAALQGAAHQAPMAFQVVVPEARRGLSCGGVRVDFVVRHGMAQTPFSKRNVATGVLHVASPAATALELVGYPERCGYLDNVATVLAELAEQINPVELANEARRAPVAWGQRLGYLLVVVGQEALAASLEPVLSERSMFTVPLAPWQPMRGAARDSRWRIAVNTEVESEA